MKDFDLSLSVTVDEEAKSYEGDDPQKALEFLDSLDAPLAFSANMYCKDKDGQGRHLARNVTVMNDGEERIAHDIQDARSWLEEVTA